MSEDITLKDKIKFLWLAILFLLSLILIDKWDIHEAEIDIEHLEVQVNRLDERVRKMDIEFTKRWLKWCVGPIEPDYKDSK